MLVTHRRLTRRGGARQVQDVTETSAVAERVLVVDDEPDIVALVAYHLAKSGYTVSTATSGPEGLAVARRDKPSLVVLDLMLPGLSGLEVMEELRGDNATSNIAVLMLTARREEGDRIKGLSLGADDYLTKPPGTRPSCRCDPTASEGGSRHLGRREADRAASHRQHAASRDSGRS